MRWFLVNFQNRGVLLIWILVGQGPTALAVGVGGVCLDIFFLSSIVSLFFLPLSRRWPDIDSNTVSNDCLTRDNQPTKNRGSVLG